jgi:hypothetical protein
MLVPTAQAQDHIPIKIQEAKPRSRFNYMNPLFLHSPNQLQPFSRWPETTYNDHLLLRRLNCV